MTFCFLEQRVTAESYHSARVACEAMPWTKFLLRLSHTPPFHPRPQPPNPFQSLSYPDSHLPKGYYLTRLKGSQSNAAPSYRCLVPLPAPALQASGTFVICFANTR
jgi:hypothetical protein